MQQQTSEWLKWRSEGIGSSDIAAILGLCPYKTKWRVWAEKKGLLVDTGPSNYAMQRGIEHEGKARAHIELTMGREFAPALRVHAEDSFLRVSLDGCDDTALIEIKVPSKEVYEGALRGIVPPHYMAQIQYQLFVSGLKEAIFACYSIEEDKVAVVPVKPDPDYQAQLADAARGFWYNHVLKGEEPELSSRDVLELKDPLLIGDSVRYEEVKRQIAELERTKEALEKHLKAQLSQHPRLKIGNLSLTRTYKKGSIDYSKVKGVDLEQFRKPGTFVDTIRVGKDVF